MARVQPVAKTAAATVVVERSRPRGGSVPRAKADMVPEDPQVMAMKDYAAPKQLVDPFAASYSISGSDAMTILEPPYNPNALLRLPNENSMLKQCIEAMVTNIHRHGYSLEYIGPEGKESSKAAQLEKTALEGILDYPNEDYNIVELASRSRADIESLGYSMIEIGRAKDGTICMLKHLPAQTMRITGADDTPISVKITLPRQGGPQEQVVLKRFRRYVQMSGSRKVYFKEFGDPRVIDPTTGKAAPALNIAASATEVLYLSLYNPTSVYGMPRWFNQLPAILGSRQSELTNLDYFRENAIPALVILVAGGQVTQESLDAIEGHVNAARGRKAQNRVLTVEAQGSMETAAVNGAIPAPTLSIQPLHKERQGDALFQNYEQNNRDKIRSSFRLPPLFVGMSQDMTYATAKTSYEVAETQVFKPERTTFDDLINNKVLSDLKPVFWRYQSNPPKLTDPDELTAALEAFDSMGALTPNIAVGIATKMLGVTVPKISEPWGDYPFPLVMAAFGQNKLTVPDLENIDPADTNAGVPLATPLPTAPGGKAVTAVPSPASSPAKAPIQTAAGSSAKAKSKTTAAASKKTTKEDTRSDVRRQLRALRSLVRRTDA